jgi:CHASE3 domain sensor protein
MKFKPDGPRPIAPTLDDMFDTSSSYTETLKPMKLNDLFDECQKRDDDEIVANMLAELDQTQMDDIDNAMDEMENSYIQVRADYLYELAFKAHQSGI